MASSPIMVPIKRGSQIDIPKPRVRSGTLSSGITTKMDVFARSVAEGMSLADAYRSAFNTANMKPRTVSNDASRLARHPGITAAVKAYRADIETRNRLNALERSERIWERLWHLIEDAAVPPAVKVRALDLAARLAGMFTVPKDISLPSEAAVEAELVQRLRSYSG